MSIGCCKPSSRIPGYSGGERRIDRENPIGAATATMISLLAGPRFSPCRVQVSHPPVDSLQPNSVELEPASSGLESNALRSRRTGEEEPQLIGVGRLHRTVDARV